MFKKVLIANRGEIAVRVIRACRELGIPTVAIYSQADAKSLHVRLATDAYCIGPAPSGDSYLNIPAIITTAVMTGCDAIHPGYGFMSERADFVDICDQHGIKFIGPSAESMRKMGDKATARKTMIENNVPVTPGTGLLETVEQAREFAHKAGYPIILKATAGGGGKGMRIVRSDNELESNMTLCQQEAQKFFGNPGVYAEKFLENPRHIEVQILGDSFGNVIHLGERDCSIQRRHQKLLEEAPSPAIDEKTRQEMGAAAVRAAKAINYEGAGTCEFLLDHDGKWYFMEMNTRVQVEHCVSTQLEWRRLQGSREQARSLRQAKSNTTSRLSGLQPDDRRNRIQEQDRSVSRRGEVGTTAGKVNAVQSQIDVVADFAVGLGIFFI